MNVCKAHESLSDLRVEADDVYMTDENPRFDFRVEANENFEV